MFTRKAVFLFLAVVFLLTGCMIRRGDIVLEDQTPEKIAQKIKIGETTRDDLQKEFGNPRSFSTASNGTQTWVYDLHIHPWFLIHRYDRKMLSVTFDANGKVSEYSLMESHW
jgi:outer membrane protein assembly factor BamE (lipoprotein component of BamABCDE complex)